MNFKKLGILSLSLVMALGAFAPAVKEVKAAGNVSPGSDYRADINGDGVINIIDSCMAKSGFLYGFSDNEMKKRADIDCDGNVTATDIKYFTDYSVGTVTAFPELKSVSADPNEYLNSVKAAMTNNVPSSATVSNNSGKLESITYYSTNAAKNKKAKVLLPSGYSSSKKYPVMYITHGIFGDENSMIGDDMKVIAITNNLIASGEAKEMILVFVSMYTSKTSDGPSGFDQASCVGYDNFLYDLTDDLMPYIAMNYSIATGRENTAITGFSMGGREALYIGVSRPDLIGYIGAACPAPGVTSSRDQFMSHPGCMQESEFKISAPNLPYVLIITGGTNDTVVGNNPENYHNILTRNGTNHIWQSIQGGGHEGNSVIPHMYNFIRAAFKAN